MLASDGHDIVNKDTARKTKFNSFTIINSLIKMRALFDRSLTHKQM